MSENPETIELDGLPIIHKLCHFASEHGLEGCTWTEIVEHLFSELEESKVFEQRYRCAIINAKKRSKQLNWAHVSSLGVGAGTAKDLCIKFGIDPSGTEMRSEKDIII